MPISVISMPENKLDTQFLVRKVRRKPATFATGGPILIVDDCPDKARLSEHAVERLNPLSQIKILGSGPELIAYLQCVGACSGPVTPVPSMIFLDLKMPEMDGFAVMEWLGKQPQFSLVPIIALTDFEDLPRLKQAYALGARSYLLKPITEDALRNVLSSLGFPV
jgi:CheY-like chemotaxis protein